MTKLPKKYGPAKSNPKKIPQKEMFGRTNELRFSMRLAEVIRVDYENMVCDLVYLQGDSPPAEEVPISAAYWSRRSFLGVMPEEGAIAVVGFTASYKAQQVRPLILTFLPNGSKTALRFDPLGPAPRNDPNLNLPEDILASELSGKFGVLRHKFRKIYPGEVLAMSRQGSELILDTDVRLFDRSGSEFALRSYDSSAIMTVLDQYSTTAAGRARAGRIIRNALNVPTDFLDPNGSFPTDHPLFEDLADAGIVFEDGTLVPDVNSLPYTLLPDGRRQSVITDNLEDPNNTSTRAYTENRIEIREFASGLLPTSDAYGFDPESVSPFDPYSPFIEIVRGTVVGNDPYTSRGRPKYGRLLKPIVFTSASSTKGDPRLEPVENAEDETEKSLVAAGLYRMERPDGLGELFLAHDKEGHVFLSIPASTSKKSNLGAGRSLEANLQGSAKLVLGGNNNDNESLDITAAGGFRWTLGTISSSKRSLDLQARGGIAIQAGPDANGDAIRLDLSGNLNLASESSFGISTQGDHLEEAVGKREIKAESYSLQVGTGNYSANVLSSYDLNIQNEMTTSIGNGKKTTIFLGGESTDILSGNSTTSFAIPGERKIDFLAAGTHTISANGAINVVREGGVSGSYSFSAPTGSYKVDLGAGSITLKSGVGQMNITPASITINAPTVSILRSVNLGSNTSPNAVVGGIPGPSPYLDPITGLPATGNPLVRTL